MDSCLCIIPTFLLTRTLQCSKAQAISQVLNREIERPSSNLRWRGLDFRATVGYGEQDWKLTTPEERSDGPQAPFVVVP